MSTFARLIPHSDDLPVVGGLSMSPSQAYNLTKEGKPVVTCELPASHFEEGTINCSFSVPLEHQRGVDIASVWEKYRDGVKHIQSHIES